MNVELLKKLSESTGVPGYEDEVRDVVKKEFEHICDEVKIDKLGSVIGHKRGDNKLKVALDAHIDEVGFMVSHIDKNGFIRVKPMGGIDKRVFYAQKIKVLGKKTIIGIVGSTPPHILKKQEDKMPDIEECFIDTGLSPEKVKELVSIGDIAVFASEFYESGDSFIGKAFDDRLGVFTMIEALKNAKRVSCDLWLVASTQEEYGLRGAAATSYSVNPEIVIAIEGTIANDVPGVSKEKLLAVQGQGPELRLMDRGMVADRALVNFITNIAKKYRIRYQLVVKKVGSTNAAVYQLSRGGKRVCVISHPVRYIHSPYGIVKKSDVDSVIKLTAAVIEKIGTIDSMQNEK
jgi:endoglucanase